MKYKIVKNNIPNYLQLYKQLREDITSNVYSYGAKMPSKRLLAEEVGVSVITVEHAYNLLSEEGYIEPKERSGYFVIYKEKDFLTSTDTIIKSNKVLKSNKKDFKTTFPFTTLSKAMRKVLLDYGDSILQKSDNKGVFELRKSISNYLKRTVGISANPSQVIIGAGAEYLYSLAIQLLGKDKIYAIEKPSYETIKKVYNSSGVKIEELPLNNNGINSYSLLSSKASVLHITPYNSYPSHVTADASKRKEYINWAKDKNGFIIEDNYDSELTISKKHEETLFSLSEEENVIYINTFSQTISPAIRVGYMVLSNKLIKAFNEKLSFYSCTVPVFEQYLLLELIESGEFERHINRIRRQKRKNNLVI